MMSESIYTQYYHDPNLQALAEKGDDAYAQFVYGTKLTHNKLLSEPPSLLAVSYIERAANNGCVDADYWLGNYYLSAPNNKEVAFSQEKGLARLESAMLQGHFEAAATLGYLHFEKNTPHDAAKSTQVWGNAIRNERGKTALKASQYLCARLSLHFSTGWYGHEKKSELAGQLTILSSESPFSEQKQKDLFLVLFQLKKENPRLFDLLQAEGLDWISELEEPKMLLYDDEIRERRGQREDVCRRFFNRIHFYNTELGQQVYDYIKSKLPPEIQRIPNMVLGIEPLLRLIDRISS